MSITEKLRKLTLSELAELRNRGSDSSSRLPSIDLVPREAGSLGQLSFAQQRLWLLAQMQGASDAYTIPLTLELRGQLDVAALRGALDALVARHESLRTSFVTVDGSPAQRAEPANVGFPFAVEDLRNVADAEAALPGILAGEAARSFDLGRGPLVHARLFQLASEHHVLALNMHHIVSDGWSGTVLLRELQVLYAARLHAQEPELSPLPLQYADYAAWQRRCLSQEALVEQAQYWRSQLADAPALLELPTDRRRPPAQDFAGDSVALNIDAHLTSQLKALSQRCGVTLYMTVLSAWSVLLSRLSGHSDLVIGTPTVNRPRRELEALIGFFVNTLALRIDTSGPLDVEGLLHRVREVTLSAQRHQDLPFEQIVEIVQPARSVAHSPIFQVMLSWQDMQQTELALADLAVRPLDGSPPYAKFDLTLNLGEGPQGLVGSLNYATALFDRSTVERFGTYLQTLLSAMVEDSTRQIDALSLLPAEERHRILVDWNATAAPYPAKRCIHELFEARATEAPDATALRFEEHELSYGELNAQANRLARHLREQGVAPGVQVAICVERSPEMVVGLMAILKAGGAYVPLDASYPADRLASMLADASPQVALVHAATAAKLQTALETLSSTPVVIDLQADAPRWADQDAGNLSAALLGLGSRDLAYVIYTSGSTGKPKGIKVAHAPVINLIHWVNRTYQVDHRDCLLFITSISFDLSVYDIFGILAAGATIQMASSAQLADPQRLAEAVLDPRVTFWDSAPAALQLLVPFLEQIPQQNPSLRLIFNSGDWIPLSLPGAVATSFPNVRFIALGGATEATIWSNHFEVHQVSRDWRSIPYGRPIQNARYYVLDAHLQPVPVGVIGNLYIAGPCLAEGYTDPQLTAERFITSPWPDIPGPLYCTGDLARFFPSGDIEFIGRNDFQVKVRGFRIELGEIEAQLLDVPGIRDAIAMVREDVPGDRRLVAYYTTAPGVEVSTEQLLAYLAGKLPDYMVPAAYVKLDTMPVTSNGKQDRKALPAPDGEAYLSRPYAAPEGEIETALARIWAEVLGVEQVGRHDNFFELGGHSLLAVRMLSLVRERFAAEVSLATVFSDPSVARFAETVARAQQPSLPAIAAVQHTQGADIPLSSNQQRLWFLTQLQGASAAYNMPSALELRGPLDVAALRRSLDALVARHASLRTAFVAVNGAPIQQVDAVGDAFPFAFDDLSDAPESASILPVLLEFEATTPFDLSQSPLARARLIRLAAQHHVLALNMHHIVSDAWSITVLIRELQALYAGFLEDRHAALPALPIQYADYALWQRQWLSHEALAAQADYWRNRLSGAPAVLELPGDRPRPTVQDFAGDSVPMVIDAALTARLKALSQQNGVTLYMTILSAWSVLLSRLSGQSDLVIGTPTANRPRLELEGLIGFFVNTLALRIDTSGSPSVAELLQRVRSAALGAQQHQDLPFEQIVEILRPTRSLSHSPVFQAMVSWQDMEHADLSLAALAVQPLQTAAPFAKFDLTLNLGEHDDALQGSLNYATALFDRSTIERFAGYLQTILSAMVENSVQRVDALPLLPREERQTLLVDWNATAKPFPAQRCVHELFEAQVEQRPEATAVRQDDRSVSYRTLNAQANRLARHLREQGVGPGVPVAICMDRSPEMMVGLMAILKAGGAYVPLDPSYPADRLAFMLADIAAPLALTHASAQDSLQAALAELALAPAVIDLLADVDAWSAQDATNLGPAPITLNSRDVAYIIYTSGSTGVPKGVLIEHHSLVNRLVWMQNTYGFGPDSRILQKTPITFDVSVWELFGPLIAGACLVLARPHGHKDPSYLIALIKEQRISIVHFVPSMLQAFIDTEGSSGCTSLEHVFCSGEALPSTLARRCLERLESTQLHNLYGPTEATVDVTSWTCPRPFDEDQQVAIGKPIDNVRTYILDPSGEPTPIGAVGELHLAGTCLARGYHNRPELTRDRFITRPLVAGERMYRTGDLARYRANGDIEYIGRNDFQVKLRGFRIELGEIEAQLASFTGVREAVVLVREDSPGDKRLVAYYTTGGAATPSHEGLSARLGAVLPDYMVPAAYIALEAMPLTDNGKLDRTALPAPDRQTYLSKPYEAPVGDIEVALAGIWTEVLGIGTIGRHDNFFELGGHSLLAVRMLERMKQSNLHANVLTVFKAPVLMQLAQVLQEETGGSHDALPPAVPAGTERITPDMVPLAGLGQEDIDHIAASVAGGMANIQDIYPLTHLQEGILFHHLMATQSDPYLMWSLVRFGERHALDAYIAALQTVVVRHDICRTAVVWEGLVSPVQVVWRDAPLQVEILEFDAAAGDVASQLLDHVDPRHYRLDLRTAPLTRIYAARDSTSNQWLVLRLVHHLIDDVTTAQLLNNEVMTLLHGNGASLPAPLPFKHVVARARHERGNVEDEAFFRTMLGGVSEPTAPFNLLNVHGDGTQVVEARHRLPASLSQQIRRRSKQLGVSAASLFHVAWAQVVARTAGRADAVFGTVLFGRMSLNESADRVFGPFINTLPILIGVEGVRASEGVRQAHQRLTELMSHEHASLALAQRCSGVAAPAPLFTAILNYRHAINEGQDASGTNTLADVEELVSEERTNYPLVLNVDDIEDDFLTTVQVMPAVDPHLVAAMVRTALESLIHALDQDPESELQTLSMLPAEERHRILVDWNATAAPYPAKRCIHELFEARATEAPDATALRFEEHELSYGELNAQANRLARHLREQGVAPGVQVAICVERSPEMVVGLMAILKAGGAYVPLDASYPADRLASMLADASPQVALVHAATAAKLQTALETLSSTPVVIDLQADAPRWADQDAGNLSAALLGLGSRDLAYVIYTSGSTGKPKGIKVAHAPVINLIHWVNRTYQVDHRDCLLFITSISFDLSVYDIFGILAAGATIQMASSAQLADPQRLAEAVLDPRVTFWDSAPAALQLLVPFLEQIPQQNPSLRLIFNSGDWIPLSLPGAVATSFPNVRFIALGGATEATIWSNHFEVHQVSRDWRSIPYGRPIQNARYYVLDAHLQPVPVGVIGNLYIAGPCLAEGYTDPQLTAERFITSPWPDIPGPLYCTGDLARFFPSGDIEFIGRNDFQVKVRGFRIELGEIEAQLLDVPGIRDAIAMVREDVPGDRRLVAYYTTAPGVEVSTEQLLAYLAGKLPDYMVPAAYVKLDTMPVTSNGKQDRKALPAPDGEAYLSRPYAAPEGEIETALARIWAEVLGVEQVGRHDNFFELGGHSLLAVRVLEHMRRSNLQTDIRTMFTTPVLADVAANTQEYGEIVL